MTNTQTIQATRYDLENTAVLLLDITNVLIGLTQRLMKLEEENNITTSASEEETLNNLNTLYSRLKENSK